jgi:hypothetical protein
MEVGGEDDLFQVILALSPGRRFADPLNGGEEKADEHGDDGDDGEEFDEREGPALESHGLPQFSYTGGTPFHENEKRNGGDPKRATDRVGSGATARRAPDAEDESADAQ